MPTSAQAHEQQRTEGMCGHALQPKVRNVSHNPLDGSGTRKKEQVSSLQLARALREVKAFLGATAPLTGDISYCESDESLAILH